MDARFIFSPRIIRSPMSDCWGREIETVLAAYPEDYLREISSEGFNGIWVNVPLGETVGSRLFPDPGNRKTGILSRLVEKTGRHGIKVYCYLLEPRALPEEDDFWEKHPGLRGEPWTHRGRTYRALCTSPPEVREFLEESAFGLFSRVPGLGGAFLINASEQHTHCYSHFPIKRRKLTDPNLLPAEGALTCPRCVLRTPPEVAAEVISLINRGIKKADAGAEVIAWTWSWYILEPDPQKELIKRLPKDVVLMSDWERGGRKKVCGRMYPVDEYSLSSAGPSPRFKNHYKTAAENGLRVMAKIQVGSTHEIASVPYIPVPYMLAEKLRRMARTKVSGYLGCWIFGGGVSPMSMVAGLMSARPQPAPGEAVRRVAEREFGKKSSAAVCRAWRRFSSAWKKYPFSIPFVYYGPINYATACTLSMEAEEIPEVDGWLPLPRDARGRLRCGDNTGKWMRPFTPGIIREAFQSLLEEWDAGVRILEDACGKNPDNPRLRQELRLAEHISLSVRSTVNIVRFYPLLRGFRTAGARGKKSIKEEIAGIFREELEITSADRKLLAEDDRLGYHPEAHCRLYGPEDLDYKLEHLRRQLDTLGS